MDKETNIVLEMKRLLNCIERTFNACEYGEAFSTCHKAYRLNQKAADTGAYSYDTKKCENRLFRLLNLVSMPIEVPDSHDAVHTKIYDILYDLRHDL